MNSRSCRSTTTDSFEQAIIDRRAMPAAAEDGNPKEPSISSFNEISNR
jgi:hypothetical protein